MSEKSPFVVSADWLEERLHEPGLSIVDGSWYLPAQGRDARAEFEQSHIPSAIFFDQDLVVDPESDLPHALPDPLTFERYANAMGISERDTIVVYDGPGFFTGPRVWWMFRVMGAEKVFLLDGGFDRWRGQRRPVTNEPTKIAPTTFISHFDESRVASLDEMRRIVETGEAQIADARPAGRFAGAEPEPRPGMRSGHMPGARNVPVTALSEDGSVLPLDRLRSQLEKFGLDLDKPVVTSCGSGVTAAAIIFALESLGHRESRLYDGSWSEWGARNDTPVATGSE